MAHAGVLDQPCQAFLQEHARGPSQVLLNERAQCSLDIRSLKPQAHQGLYDPRREEEIFSNIAKCNNGPLYADDLREIYEAILHVAKEMRG